MGKGGEILVHYQPADLLRLHHCFCGCVHPFSDPSGVWPASSGFLNTHFPFVGARDWPADRFQIPVVFLVLFFFSGGFIPLCRKSALKAAKADSGSALFRFGMDGFSLGFSIYFNRIGGRGYSYMYGSLAAIVIPPFVAVFLYVHSFYGGRAELVLYGCAVENGKIR